MEGVMGLGRRWRFEGTKVSGLLPFLLLFEPLPFALSFLILGSLSPIFHILFCSFASPTTPLSLATLRSLHLRSILTHLLPYPPLPYVFHYPMCPDLLPFTSLCVTLPFWSPALPMSPLSLYFFSSPPQSLHLPFSTTFGD